MPSTKCLGFLCHWEGDIGGHLGMLFVITTCHDRHSSTVHAVGLDVSPFVRDGETGAKGGIVAGPGIVAELCVCVFYFFQSK